MSMAETLLKTLVATSGLTREHIDGVFNAIGQSVELVRKMAVQVDRIEQALIDRGDLPPRTTQELITDEHGNDSPSGSGSGGVE